MPEPPDSADSAEVPTLSAPPPATRSLPAKDVAADQQTLTRHSSSTPSVAPDAASTRQDAGQARPFGDYELLGEIARGGMGIVYRARERKSGRLVALKMMLADSAVDATYVQRFALEAKATGELSHPGVVAIHAWGQHEGQFFYTMDYVPGLPLSRILRRRPLAVPRAVHYLLGIARAVAAAHMQGIVHRDLKPSNVVIDATDQPRVLDFGLAKRHRALPLPGESGPMEVGAVDDVVDVLPADAELPTPKALPDSKDTPPQTKKGAVLGTPSYMAPEQARGEHSKVGPAADVHALGAIFFEMLTGRPPFEAATMMDTLIQVIEQQPPSISALNRRVPAALQEVCLHCLEKDPRNRYPDAGALADDLERRWRSAAQKRKFARRALVSGLLFGVLLFIDFVLLDREWLTLDALSHMAANKAAIGGPMMQGTASILATLLGSILSVVPFLCLLAFLVWLAAWLAYSLKGRRRAHPDTDASPQDSEPYLQKLFAVRAEPVAQQGGQTSIASAVDLADIDFARTLHESQSCLVRKGRQKSLDRPVLVWLDPQPASAGTAAPGVVVRHPSILNLHAVGACPEGRYLVTEPAAATPLAELLERRSLDPLEAAFLIVKVAYALQAFHDQDVCHGRLSSHWILAQGDLEPLLCPCGVPSQAPADRQGDVTALGRLLRDWLPPRPRHWWRLPLAMLYQVCAAAEAGEYERPADVARDLERAARAAHVRWWERTGTILFLIVWALPLLACVVGVVLNYAASSDPETRAVPQASLFLAQHLLMIVAPSAVLLGFVQSWGVVRSYRLRLRCAAFARLMRGKALSILLLAILVTIIPAMLACVALNRIGHPISFLVWLLATAELLGFWLLGLCLMGLVTFGELLIASVRSQPGDDLLTSGALISAPESSLASPQEAARTLGGRTRWQ